MKSTVIHLVSTVLCMTLTSSSTTCPATCQCTDKDTQCVDQVLFDIPRLPVSTVRLNLSNIFLGPSLSTPLGYLTNLTHLHLSSNIIVRISNSTFRGLHRLTHLDLSNNKIKTLEEHLFEENPNLQVLDLSGNSMDSLDGAFYRYLTNLKELYLSGNNFFHLKLGLRFQVLDQLQVLDLSDNDFGDVANDAFENVHRWRRDVQRKLNLENCKISSVENGTFILFRGLHDLDLSGVTTLNTNNITLIMNDIQLTNTKRLDLSNMNLINVDTVFRTASRLSLEVLNLSHNQIENIAVNAFGNLGSLLHLNMSFNNMKLLPPSFTTLGNIKVLDISHNSLKALNGPAVTRMAKLEILKATHNKFKQRSLLQLNSLQQLKVLDMSNNFLDALVTSGSNAKLEKLILAANNITSLEMIPEAPRLKVLDISQNRLTALGPYMFSSSVNIETVDFSGNMISVVNQLAFLPNSSNAYNINLSGNKLTRIHFGGWTSARVLNLSNNSITHVDFHTFQGMNSLEVLDLSHNKILEFDEETFKYLINLNTLNLAHNLLENHPTRKRIVGTFTTLVSLRTMDMSSNNITYLDINVFEDNMNLLNLSLANNKFSSIQPGMFYKLKKLQNLNIYGNPFICSCDLLPLVSWLQKIDPLIYRKFNHKLNCAGPSARASMTIFDYEVGFLECNEDLLEVIVFASLGGLTILVGIIGTIVCRSYQRWSEGVAAKKEKEKKATKTDKATKMKGSRTVEELPLEILDELDHHLKLKLMSAKQNGYGPIANGGLHHNREHTDKSNVNSAVKDKEKNRKEKNVRDSSRSRSRSHSKDKKSRSKSKERDRSQSRERREKRDRDRIRRFEKELRYTLARYNPTSRWDAEGRDRWATMGGDWVSRREYNPVKADKFSTMPFHRQPRQTLLDDRELERRVYTKVQRYRQTQQPDQKTLTRDYPRGDPYQRRLSPVHRYDIVRVPRRPDTDAYERKEPTHGRWSSYPGIYTSDPYVHYGKERQRNERSWPEPYTEPRALTERQRTGMTGYESNIEPRSRGDKRAYDYLKHETTNGPKLEPHFDQERSIEREYIELPFPDTKHRSDRQQKPDVTFQPHRSRSYGSIDFKAKKRRFEEDELEMQDSSLPQTMNQEKDFRSDIYRHERYKPDFHSDNASHSIPTNRDNNQVQADIQKDEERKCPTPDPDYPSDNTKLKDWV